MSIARYSALVCAYLVASFVSLRPAFAAPPDILYVGDGATNTVRRFNATTHQPIPGGKATGVYVKPQSGGLIGPRGLQVVMNKLFVVNQNVNQPEYGEILRFNLANGAVLPALVTSDNPNAPDVPRGMVYWKGAVYVADFTVDGEGGPGKLVAFSATSGKFLADFVPPLGFAHSFHPRGLVIGPNGLLYVSNVPNFPLGDGGEILVFDPKTLHFVGAFVTDVGGVGQLNHPEGLVFGPDGNLYITSFPSNSEGSSDNNSVRIYHGATGVYLDRIVLDPIGAMGGAAQALLFGPGGKLYVACTEYPSPSNGGSFDPHIAIRAYDVSTKVFTSFTAAGAGEAWFLTFGKTRPGTLSYPAAP